MNHETAEHVKQAVDITAIGGVLATLAGWLPEISALLSVIWVSIRIIETDTVQKLVKRIRQ